MADKLVKQQKRRRWAETGVVFPLAFAEKVHAPAVSSLLFLLTKRALSHGNYLKRFQNHELNVGAWV